MCAVIHLPGKGKKLERKPRVVSAAKLSCAKDLGSAHVVKPLRGEYTGPPLGSEPHQMPGSSHSRHDPPQGSALSGGSPSLPVDRKPVPDTEPAPLTTAKSTAQVGSAPAVHSEPGSASEISLAVPQPPLSGFRNAQQHLPSAKESENSICRILAGDYSGPLTFCAVGDQESSLTGFFVQASQSP